MHLIFTRSLQRAGPVQCTFIITRLDSFGDEPDSCQNWPSSYDLGEARPIETKLGVSSEVK